MSKYRTIIAQLMCVMVLISGCAAQSGSGDQTNQSDSNSTESAAAEDVDNADGSAADGGAESNSAAGESVSKTRKITDAVSFSMKISSGDVIEGSELNFIRSFRFLSSAAPPPPTIRSLSLGAMEGWFREIRSVPNCCRSSNSDRKKAP